MRNNPMKTNQFTETIIDPKKRVGKETRNAAKSLTLDEIEEKMMQLITDETTDVLQTMINEKKLGMLEKVANFKLHRLQLKDLEKQPEEVDVKPLEIVFVNSDTEDQQARVDRIDNEIREKRHIKQDA